MTVTRTTIIGQILDADRTTAPYFLEMGMHCLGCPSARNESVAQACMVHGVNPDELIGKTVILVSNLKPATLCGVESCGMILAADAGEDDVKVVFLENVPAGSKIR